MKKSKLKIVQWIFSVIFILEGIGLMIGENLLFIFMVIFGLLINPKFNDIYVKITKKEPLEKVPRIIASVVSFLMIYVAIGVYSATQNEDTITTDSSNYTSKEVFTEIATTQTELTTTEPVEITTKKVTTIKETTQEVTTETVKEASVTTKEKEEITSSEEYSTDIVALTLQTIACQCFDDASVIYDDDSDTYIISIIQNGLTASMLAVQNGTIERSEWDSMLDAMCESCKNVYEQVQEMDKGANVSYFLINDVNTDNVLVTILNGVVIADALNQ